MIALLLCMVAARRAQALTVFLLSAVAIGAAVAGPVAQRTVDQAVVRQEVAAATNTERSLSVTAFVNPSDSQASNQFDTIAHLLTLPGFDPIRSGELEAFGPVRSGVAVLESPTSRVAFRDRLCDHLIILSGRCLAGSLEVVVGEDTAKKAGLHAGDVTVLQAARYVQGRGLVPDGDEARLTVVGIYRPRDADEPYWAGQRYFPVTTDGTRQEAVFTNLLTFDLIDHTLGQASIDALVPAPVLTLERLSGLRREIEAATEPLAADPGFALDTDLPALADRVVRSRDLAGQLVPVAFVPLVALSLFVIFLAVGYGVVGRRTELGLVALRGVTPARRWWLATGETALMVLAAAPVGYLLGYGGVALVARIRLGSADGAGLGLAAVPYAAAALAGALLMVVLGQRRALAEPVVELLRGVTRARAVWRAYLVEVLVLVLAVVATVQLRTAGGGLAGVALLVPGLVVVAVALLAARGFAPAVGALARAALRRGRLAAGLAAVQVARRPGSQRLFVLLAVASAMLAFAAAGLDVAARAREDRARVVTGASAVLTVDQADVRRLLYVTRTVDPEGSWAMAAIQVGQADTQGPPVLAVDSPRLGAVAAWRPEFGAGAAAVAQALAPPPAQPFVFRGTQLLVDLETSRPASLPPLELNLAFAPLTGGDVVSVAVTDLAAGRAVRQVGTLGCTDGCLLTGLSVPALRGDQIRVLVHAIRQLDPPADVVPGSQLIQRARWRTEEGVQVAAVGQALAISANLSPFQRDDVDISAVDAKLPVPVVSAGEQSPTGVLTSLDNESVDTRTVATVAMLPRLGIHGTLVDVEYLERTALRTLRREQAEVWLGPRAPADAAERLRKAGLAISAATGYRQSLAALSRQGPALALQFHLAAALFGMVLGLGGLGLVAAVDRAQRAADFRALRQQGLAAAVIRRATLGGYLAIVGAAALVGLAAAIIAWWVAGDRLPIFTDSLDVLTPPRWPNMSAVLGPWAAVLLVMLIGAVAAASALSVVRNGKG